MSGALPVERRCPMLCISRELLLQIWAVTPESIIRGAATCTLLKDILRGAQHVTINIDYRSEYYNGGLGYAGDLIARCLLHLGDSEVSLKCKHPVPELRSTSTWSRRLMRPDTDFLIAPVLAHGLRQALASGWNKVRHLDLHFLCAGAALPLLKALKKCPSLTHLSISASHIKNDGALELAHSLSSATLLTHLDLSHNDICGEGLEGLALSLQSCASLRSLNLAHNSLCYEYDGFYSDDEDEFRLGKGLRRLGDTMEAWVGLKELILSGNHMFNEGHMKALSRGLRNCTVLERLELADCAVGNSEVDRLVEGLETLSTLKILNLSQFIRGDIGKIGPPGMAKLAPLLERSRSLQVLSLAGNLVGPQGGTRLAEALSQCNELHTLDLSRNEVEGAGVRALARTLLLLSSLQHLDLGENNSPDDGSRELAQVLRRSTGLRFLDLSYNWIQGGTWLADGLRDLGSLSHLDLFGCGLGDQDMCLIAESLRNCSALTQLSLGENYVRVNGIKKIADTLPNFVDLKCLQLSFNLFEDRGATSLSGALKKCSKLKEVHLAACGIEDQGAIAIVDSLMQSTGLTMLNMGNSDISGQLIKQLKRDLQELPLLRNLHLGWHQW